MIHDLKIVEMKAEDDLLPHFSDWKPGNQAQLLRGFCQANKLPLVRFHALRACFATQLISAGIPKIMQRYIRMAGIDEAGATEILHFIPTE